MTRMDDRHHIRLEYCVPGGALPNAAGLAARILQEWEDSVGAVEIVTGVGGIFDVNVDDELVFTKSMLGRYPDPDDVLPLLRAKLGP